MICSVFIISLLGNLAHLFSQIIGPLSPAYYVFCIYYIQMHFRILLSEANTMIPDQTAPLGRDQI